MIKLKSLIGLRLSIVRFYANTLGLHFGEIRTRVRGGTVGAFALHVGSPWRIDGQSKTITGSADRWEYGGDGERPACWAPEEGPTLLDKKLSEIFGQRDQDGSWRNETSRYFVTAVETTIFGDLIVAFSNELTIRVFPATARVESWRFFAPDDEAPHLIFPTDAE